MIQPEALHDGPQANLSKDSQLEDFQGLLVDNGGDESEDIMFPAEDVILAMTQTSTQSEFSIMDDALEASDPALVFDASPEAAANSEAAIESGANTSVASFESIRLDSSSLVASQVKK